MIKITADSTCDLSPEILKAMDITLVPLSIIMNDKDFHDGVDITPAYIFNSVERQETECKTAAVNVYEYECLFNELSPRYEAVIHICLSSGFSTCYQNAVLASRKFENVYVVDSRNLSSGSGLIVLDAAEMAREGNEPEEICRSLEMSVPKVDASFVIDRLDYLYKGGRCSGLEVVGAKLLQIKPCIEVVDGKMKVGKKYRGSFEHCLENYVKDRLISSEDIDYSRVFITHPMCSPETIARVRETICRYADFDEIIETNAGCTISSHCGPNTLGILFKRKHRKLKACAC
ncbi:DegV family protein [Desulfitobacterium sp.]|uniref:DegV family protein n=1 Tax=Desulfitobacterium sp. TaxID=49981 RepID=UPI002B1FD7FB|nr:DegV family protein [Desulfitobacterium sp.]MEA4901751.1 DegV family protein [Desulfitobacterium sp.]